MHKRPLSLFGCALLFLYFPVEMMWRVYAKGAQIVPTDFVLSVVLPLILLVGLIRVTLVGWYTLVTLVSLWGVRDLYDYYNSRGATIGPLLVHLGIYALSLAYFINPRIRHLYFDPRQRWWRTKRRYETHMPFLMSYKSVWHYPILRNVSEGGCFIETPHLLEVDQAIQIHIPLPVPLNVSVIKAEGEVRWVSRNPLRHGMGIQFKDPDPEQSRALADFVRKEL